MRYVLLKATSSSLYLAGMEYGNLTGQEIMHARGTYTFTSVI